MATQKKVVVTSTQITEAEAEKAMIQFSNASLNINKINADIDLKIQEIKDKRKDKLDEHATMRDQSFAVLEQFAHQNSDSFLKKKSMEIAGGIIGFRTGTPALKTLKGYTWPSVLNLVKRFLPDYVAVKEDVAKAKIIQDKDQLYDQMKQIGVEIVQEESFYVDVKTV